MWQSRRVQQMLMGLSLMLLLTACHHDKDKPEVHDYTLARTVLVYMVAENSLSPYATYSSSNSPSDIDEMLAAKTSLTKNDHLVIYLDNVGEPRIYDITNKTKATKFSELKPAYTFPKEVNSASPDVLAEVLTYVEKHYPADVYGLIGWSHGSAWVSSTYEGDKKAPRRSFGLDNGQNNYLNIGHQMNIDEMAAALATFPKFEFILFDACFMQSVEVAYELRHCAKYLIGSPAEIPAPGAPYHEIVPVMFDDTKTAPHIAQSYYEYYASSYYGSLMSVVDCTELEGFAAVTHRMIEQHRNDLLNLSYGDRLNYFSYDWVGYKSTYPDFYDMQGLMQAVLTEEEYSEWKAAFDKMCVAAYHSSSWYSAYPVSKGGNHWTVNEEQYCGLSMFVPLDKYKYGAVNFSADYQNTSWAQDVWNEK